MTLSLQYLISIASVLALTACILFYKIKIALRENGYKITLWYGHLFDIILMAKFSIESKRYTYLLWLLLLFILVTSFLYVSTLIIGG